MTSFQGNYIPKNTRLAGTAKIVNELKLSALIRHPHAISNESIRKNTKEETWDIYSSKYWPGDGVFEHLVFAIKYEIWDLLVFKNIFEAININELENFIQLTPVGSYSRKIWFLYEWLTEKKLSLRDVPMCNMIDLLDEEKYFTLKGEASKRHRINNNLIGTNGFNAIIEKNKELTEFLAHDYKHSVDGIIKKTSHRLIARAASFLLLADTKATFEIEGELAPKNRLERWGKAILQSGKHPLSKEELIRLHGILLKDDRFTKIGIREDEVFIGDRTEDGDPLPEFIGAKATDLQSIMVSWFDLEKKLKDSDLHPLLQATIMAFAFIYIHPLQDGNGRLHRYLIHHILADRDFSPKGIIFPISAVIANRIEDYRNVLVSHSGPLMDYINWETDDKKNVKILNETNDLYRFLNCTSASEFLFSCLAETIDTTLPKELRHLQNYDRAANDLAQFIELPDNQISLLINLITSNEGKLSKGKRKKYFIDLTDEDVEGIEEIVGEAFQE